MFQQVDTPHQLARELAQCAHDVHVALAHDTSFANLLTTILPTTLPTTLPTDTADMAAQTLVYGMFAAHAMLLHTPCTRTAALTALATLVPTLQSFFLAMRDFTPTIGILDNCASLLTHTDMSVVLHDIAAMHQQNPVLHFYELFLSHYAPTTRQLHGVYYTPEPVVGYMVRSVDALLRTHFAIPMGLADGATRVFDPATGTGTFLHAIVRQIYDTLSTTGMAHAWHTYVANNLLPRLVGCELLMAPYAIAHLSLRLLLHHYGNQFHTDANHQALHILHANALEKPLDTMLLFPHHLPVIVGNPPYSNYGIHQKQTWIQQILTDYKRDLHEKKLNLDDNFIMFMRLGQWYIEQAGQGVLAFITSNTYLDGITHRRMRQSLLETFTDMYILNMHGGSFQKEVCPNGLPDDNVFAIRQGVAIGLFVKAPHTTSANCFYADVWGTREQKYSVLANNTVQTIEWTRLSPHSTQYFLVPKPMATMPEYTTFTALPAIFCVQQNALKTDRDALFIDADYATLAQRIATLFSDEAVQSPFRDTYRVVNSSSYQLVERRARATYQPKNIRQCLYRPFDVRWLYYDPHGFTSRPAYGVMRHMLHGANIALLSMRQYVYQVADYCYAFVTQHVSESRVFISNRGGASVFPLYLYTPMSTHEHPNITRHPNISPSTIRTLEHHLHLTFVPEGNGDFRTTIGTVDVFHVIYALLHSPLYRTRYAELLKVDYPRIPLLLLHNTTHMALLAAHGAALVDLHLLRVPAPGASPGAWVGGAGGAAMLCVPTNVGIMPHHATDVPIGNVSYDANHQRVMLSAESFIAGIAPTTWRMQVGGYSPLHKWLKDRKGHTLTCDDVLHYMRMVVALRETRRLMDEIDVIMRDAVQYTQYK